MRLVLRRGTRTEFESFGDAIFNIADTVLLTDPPTLVSSKTNGEAKLETPLEQDPTIDASDLLEFEVRRIDDGVVVRIGDDAWRAEMADPIRFTFPCMLGTRPVSIGRATI